MRIYQPKPEWDGSMNLTQVSRKLPHEMEAKCFNSTLQEINYSGSVKHDWFLEITINQSHPRKHLLEIGNRYCSYWVICRLIFETNISTLNILTCTIINMLIPLSFPVHLCKSYLNTGQRRTGRPKDLGLNSLSSYVHKDNNLV